jgi:hypothetical protein
VRIQLSAALGRFLGSRSTLCRVSCRRRDNVGTALAPDPMGWGEGEAGLGSTPTHDLLRLLFVASIAGVHLYGII